MSALTLTLILSVAGGFGTPAQDGGRIPWKGRGSGDPTALLADARRQQLPVMLFFTSEG